MPFDRFDAPADSLKNHLRMAIFKDPENPLFLHAIGFDAVEGFTGATVVSSDHISMEDLFSALDEGVLPRDGSISIAHNELVSTWIEDAMRPNRDIEPGRNPYLGFVAAEIPEATAQMFRDMPWIPAAVESLNHFCTGNREARRDTALHLPIMATSMIVEPQIVSAIDKADTQGLFSAIAKTWNLTEIDMKKMLRIEAMAAFRIGEKAEAGAALPDYAGWTRSLSGSFLKGHLAKKMGILNSDQFPKDLENADAASLYINQVQRLAESMGIGFTPWAKAMRRVGATDWSEARRLLPGRTPGGQNDYLKRIDLAVKTAIFVGAIREAAPDLIASVSKTADAVWNEEPVSEDQAKCLSSYLGLMGRIMTYQARHAPLELIGEVTNLKEIREFSTRWHHVQQTMDNEMLSAKSELSWNPVLGSVEKAGIRARELISSEDLNLQGSLEKHCVGGYTSTVLGAMKDSARMIFSIEEARLEGFAILSTIEVSGEYFSANKRRNEPEQVNWRVLQHKGKRNSEPSSKAETGAAMLLSALKEIRPGDFKAYLGSIRSNTGAIRDMLSASVLKLKANATNPDVAETALSIHAEVLPKALRELDWKGWLDKIRDLESQKDYVTPFHKVVDDIVRNAVLIEIPKPDIQTAEPEIPEI